MEYRRQIAWRTDFGHCKRNNGYWRKGKQHDIIILYHGFGLTRLVRAPSKGKGLDWGVKERIEWAFFHRCFSLVGGMGYAEICVWPLF